MGIRGIILLMSLFVINNAKLRYNHYWYDKPQTVENRQTMVHLFEWKWPDIASECENFLQYYGYGAVQISPPNDHLVFVLNDDVPFYVRYQPVSYKLISRSGDEAQFKDMVERCNNVGVRIIVDVVLNHMVGVNQKSGEDGRSSSANSFFDSHEDVESFPDVPYSKNDSNDYRCRKGIEGNDYGNRNIVRNCRLTSLLDLDQGRPHVRKVMADYLNRLIAHGVAGFRVDAAKHMWPGDLKAILDATNNLREDIFGPNERPFVVYEVIDRGGEDVQYSQYTDIGRFTNFNYGPTVSAAASGSKNWRELSNFGRGYHYGNAEDHDVLNFIDNHDVQRDSNPGVLTYKQGDRYSLAVAFMLAWPYGYPRVMSSYNFTSHAQGPPNSGKNGGYETTSPRFHRHDLTCRQDSGWVCEHRWPTIREMARFRSVTHGAAAGEIVTEDRRLAFARLGKGFFAVNGRNDKWSRHFSTTMPAGEYCNQYRGTIKHGRCTSQTISVRSDGWAYVEIDGNQAVAISVPYRREHYHTIKTPVTLDFQRTVVFLKKDTNQGQHVFIRGGVSRGACSGKPYQQSNDPCAIPIVHDTRVPFVYKGYLDWSQGDHFLDFAGAEQRQGTYNGMPPEGTPMVYTVNDDPAALEYQPYNNYGVGYWMVQLLMDCTQTQDGWFEFKGFFAPSSVWEPDIQQNRCTGEIGGEAPFRSRNHIARCGAVNVFVWGQGDCIINSV